MFAGMSPLHQPKSGHVSTLSEPSGSAGETEKTEAHSTDTTWQWRLWRADSPGSCSPAPGSSWGRNSPDLPVYLRGSSFMLNHLC